MGNDTQDEVYFDYFQMHLRIYLFVFQDSESQRNVFWNLKITIDVQKRFQNKKGGDAGLSGEFVGCGRSAIHGHGPRTPVIFVMSK